MAAPSIEYTMSGKCTNCGKETFKSSATSETQAKEELRKGITASEIHDCKVAAQPQSKP